MLDALPLSPSYSHGWLAGWRLATQSTRGVHMARRREAHTIENGGRAGVGSGEGRKEGREGGRGSGEGSLVRSYSQYLPMGKGRNES